MTGHESILKGHTPEQVLEAELSWIASLVLFFSTVYCALRLDVLWTVFGITAISLYVLPIVSMRDPFRAIPWEMTILLSSPIILHISESSRRLTESFAWWDDLTSMAFAFSLTTIGFLLTVELHMFTDVRMNRPFAVFFVVIFTLAVSGFWQLGEYIGDVVWGTNYQGTNEDVMRELAWSLIGGLAMGAMYDLYIKAMSVERRTTLGFIHLWEVQKWKRD